MLAAVVSDCVTTQTTHAMPREFTPVVASRKEVAIDVQGHHDGRMPKERLNLFGRIDAACKEVTKRVQGYLGPPSAAIAVASVNKTLAASHTRKPPATATPSHLPDVWPLHLTSGKLPAWIVPDRAGLFSLALATRVSGTPHTEEETSPCDMSCS